MSGNASSSSQRVVEGVGENEYEGGVKDRQKEHVRKNEAERKCAWTRGRLKEHQCVKVTQSAGPHAIDKD